MSADFTPVMKDYKNPHFFRFWCQKVLPLVYDDSLSYYELLCKVVKYLNDVIEDSDMAKENIAALKEAFDRLQNYVNTFFDNLDVQDEVNAYIAELIENGTFEGILRNALVGTLVNESYYSPYAQILPVAERVFNTGLYAQGFAIGELNNRPVSLTCFTDNIPAGTGNVFSIDYFDTGENIAKVNVASGHCNSATFNKTTGTFFIACGGGNSTVSKVIEVNTSGAIISEKEFSPSPWGITWNADKFYILLSGNILITTDNELIETNRTNIETFDEYTYQGAFSDDLYLYLPCGNTIINPGVKTNRNMITVYNHDGTLYKVIESFFPLEIEEGDFYNDVCYINSNTNDINLVVKADLYEKNIAGYLGFPKIENIVNVTQSVYINEEYNGFLMDGSTNHPVSTLLLWPYFVRSSTGRVNLNLRSDCPSHVLAMFTNCPYTVVVNGNNHKILRVNWAGCNYIALNNLVLIGETGQVSCHITAARFYSSNLTFGEEETTVAPSRCLELLNGGFEITNITFNHTGNIPLYVVGNGYMRNFVVNVNALPSVFLDGSIDVDDSFPYLKLQDANNYNLTYKPAFTLTENIDITALYFPAVLNVRPGTVTIENLPEGFTNATVTGIIVEGLTNTKALVTIINQTGEITQLYNYKN